MRPKMKLFAVKFKCILEVFAWWGLWRKFWAHFHNLCVQKWSCFLRSLDAFWKFSPCEVYKRSCLALSSDGFWKFSPWVIPCLIEHPCSPTLIKYDESGLFWKSFKNNNQQKNLNKISQTVTEWQTFQFYNKVECYGHAWVISALYSLPLKINWWFFFESHVFWGADLKNDSFILVKWSFHCQNLHFECLVSVIAHALCT